MDLKDAVANVKDVNKMTVYQAIAIITAYPNNLFKVPKKNLQTELENKSQWFCKGHKKVHKYTFHSRVSCLGDAKMYGVDNKKELVELAKTFIPKA